MTRGTQIWLVVFALASTLFATWPGIDLATAALFHGPEGWAGRQPVPEAVRGVLWKLTEGTVLVLLAALLIGWLAGPARRVPLRLAAFGFGAMLLGPGLLVNVILKAHWGRMRPNAIQEFGGTGTFTPPFRMAGECLRNCSFVSGEVAGAVTVALILWLLVFARIPGPRRRIAAALLIAVPVIVSALRIAAGGHFLSDTIFATLFCTATTLILWRVTGAQAHRDALTPASALGDLRAAAARLWRFTGIRP